MDTRTIFLELAYTSSSVPENPSARAGISDLLVRVRLTEDRGGRHPTSLSGVLRSAPPV